MQTTQMEGGEGGGVCFWYWWASLALSPSWIVWGGILRSYCSACGAKPGALSRPVTKGPWLTISWPCPPSWYWLLSHIYPHPPGWWEFLMGSRFELGGLLMTTGSHIGPNKYFPGVSPGVLLGVLLYIDKYWSVWPFLVSHDEFWV